VKKYYGQRLFVRVGGALLVTPLFLVLVLIEFTDIIFAVDSIPAIFAVTSEPFLVFTANAFALLGLRAMYFLLADLMHRFIYLKVGLALVLVWVGIKMGLHDVVKVPSGISLAVILLILATSIVVSLVVSRNTKVHHAPAEMEEKFPEATPEEIAQLTPLWRRSVRM
jgi:tellurite resistance protein TerC